ncbi:signal peptidase II [candidate division KSB1 bacterium]|nr:signal peptidase II [candidate division KSB1 bacterium]
MQLTIRHKNAFALVYSVAIVIFDQITKQIVKANLTIGEPVELAGRYVRLNYLTNPGMAFGIEVGSKMFFIVFSGIATIFIAIFLLRLKENNPWTRAALSIIIGGALGNNIDRIWSGEVVDFIEISPWPIFNVADIALTCGMIMLIIIIFHEKKQHSTSKEEGFEIG